MSDPIIEALLASVETGEELVDPRAGDHNGVLSEVGELKVSQSGNSFFNVTFGNLESGEGDPFSFSSVVVLPTRDSDEKLARMFLANLHDYGILPREYRNAVYAETDEQRTAIRRAFEAKKGTTYPVRLKLDKEGDLRLRIKRTR